MTPFAGLRRGCCEIDGLLLRVCRVFPIVVLLLGSLVWTVASGAVIKMSLEQLALKASIIVVGKVTAKARERMGGRVKTRVTLVVEDSLKGEVGQTVIITQPGGARGKVERVVADAATFEVGEEVVVFLCTRSKGEHTVLGLFQGKLSVASDTEGRKFLYLSPEKGRGPKEKVWLEDFVRRLKEILEKERKSTGDSSKRE